MKSHQFFIAYVTVAIVLGVFFLVIMPVIGYKKGKETGKAGKRGSLTLAFGGVIFFACMMGVAYLEANDFNRHNTGYEGVIPGIISLMGILALFVGVIWRVIAGLKKK